MSKSDVWRSLAAECLGSVFLLAGIVGSAIMASRLAGELKRGLHALAVEPSAPGENTRW